MVGALLKRRLKALAADQSGFTIVELMVAIVVLSLGILGTIGGFDTSRRLSLVSERHGTMSHIAEREIERIEGQSYATIALPTSPSSPDFAPAHSSDPGNPDFYVANGSPLTLQVDRTGSATEPIDQESTGQVPHFQTETDGTTSYSIYDYVTWAADSQCSPACTGSENYKRITVAVTVTSGVQPSPVYSQSVIADPAATPPSSCANANCGNPVNSPGTFCQDQNNVTVQCNNGINSGNSNNWYLHDDPMPPGGGSLPTPPPIPSTDHPTACTTGACNNLTCPTSLGLGGVLGDTSGCPIIDGMDSNPPTSSCISNCSGPSGDPTPIRDYSTDLVSSGLAGLQLNSSGVGTGSSSDCSNGAWSDSLLSVQNHMWVSSPVTASTTFTGDGALSMFSQMAGGTQNANAVVSFCLELYDIPPTNGVAGSLADILLSGSQPSAMGGAAYVPPSDPNTGGNWPSSGPAQTSFTFRFLSSPTAVYVLPAGHRLGVRVWAKVNTSAAVDLLYDNPNYPASLELNSQ